MATLPPDPYKALGVTKDAQLHEIRRAHRKLVLKCHPDKFADPILKAQKQVEFQKVQKAYELVIDEERRSQYDDQVKILELRKEVEVRKERVWMREVPAERRREIREAKAVGEMRLREATKELGRCITTKETNTSSREEPPVIKATLSELDVDKIVHNPRLRHDINFDPDLHFRPNLDGEKGRKSPFKYKVRSPASYRPFHAAGIQAGHVKSSITKQRKWPTGEDTVASNANNMGSYRGHVRTQADATKLFDACRLGLLPRVQRELSAKERESIKSGSVFIWDEREASMRRWTDGKRWSASKISGCFLTYRELEVVEHGDGYKYKQDGLVKQSFSMTTSNGQHLHLVSYYSPNEPVRHTPTTDPALQHITLFIGIHSEAKEHENQIVYANSTFDQQPRLSRTVVPGLPRPQSFEGELPVLNQSNEAGTNPDENRSQSPEHDSSGEESYLYVNAKQFHRILKRRVARQRLEETLRLSSKDKKKTLHDSHPYKRPRGPGGRFLTADGVLEHEIRKGDGEDPPSRRFRRGRGSRQVIGENGTDDPNDPNFFVRDIEFRSTSGSPNQARCRMDSQCHVPLLVSEHWVRENEKWSEVSSDFHDPGVQSVSGHDLHISGILRNTVFNLKGSTVTYRRDIYVCRELNSWADMIVGAKFMAEQFAVLFSKAKKMFAGIFSSRREKPDEKAKRHELQADADRQAHEQEQKLRARKEEKARERQEAQRKELERQQREESRHREWEERRWEEHHRGQISQ